MELDERDKKFIERRRAIIGHTITGIVFILLAIISYLTSKPSISWENSFFFVGVSFILQAWIDRRWLKIVNKLMKD